MIDFLRNFSWRFYLLSEFLSEICCKKKYFLYFVLMSSLLQNIGFTSRKPTHYLLDHVDWTLLLRKRRWNYCHRQFRALWSCDNWFFFACNWRIQLGEYVVSTRRCDMPHNTTEYDFIAIDIPWLRNFSSFQYELATNIMLFDTIRLFWWAMRKTVFMQINLQLLST